MPDVVQSPKNKRQPSGLVILILVSIIALVAAVVNTMLRRSLEESEQVVNLLLQLQGLAYRLSAREWQSISMGEMSSELIEDVQATRTEMQRIMEELKHLDPNPKYLTSVQDAFTAYNSSITEEFNLIMTGDLDQARIVDEEQVDPAFNVLEEELASISAAYNEKATRVRQAIGLGFTLLLFFIVATTALVFWRFQKAQAAIEREHLDELKAINMELDANQQSLEQRVVERTAELKMASGQIERRARQFEAISKVSRSISSSTSLQTLLPDITHVISEQFGYYYVSIFLNDNSNQCAVLAATNCLGGEKTLERGYQLEIGEQSIVGYAIGTGNPRIALDEGEDAVYFNNSDLPEIHSEMALPLRIAGKIIGALDVQSTEPNAFSNEDVVALSALADQVSITIENIRLFNEVQQLAITDGLTGLYNRRYFMELAQTEFERSRRYKHRLSVMIFDIDHFKIVNDTYGHPFGDNVLQAIAKLCKEKLREVDPVARYGGEEFIALIVETSLASAKKVAERLRTEVEKLVTHHAKADVRVTISIGLAEQNENTPTLETLIARADQAMYVSKHKGRNRVSVGR